MPLRARIDFPAFAGLIKIATGPAEPAVTEVALDQRPSLGRNGMRLRDARLAGGRAARARES